MTEDKEFRLVKITKNFVVDKDSHEIFEVSFIGNAITGYKSVCRLEYDKDEKRFVVAERNGNVAIGIIEIAKMVLLKLREEEDEV